ncbi:MAG TPA: glycolate oxidase subunit GlcF [Burkholderiaceae bacterium]|nr:glycolate oxidase subunit GlcF [Burkholderiaceae bacterium]
MLRACVHCGFCNATCPTFQIMGDELEGPRGRIYLMKNVLEGEDVSRNTQLHLDRCLTCRNCETTCPSGVEYSKLLDIGREVVDKAVPRPFSERVLRKTLAKLLPQRTVFASLLRVGQWAKPVLSKRLAEHIPETETPQGHLPARRHARQVALLDGCVQPVLTPNTNRAATRVFDHFGVSALNSTDVACCGANEYHLGEKKSGLDRARKNIDYWNNQLDAGLEALVVTASGCGAFIKEYADLLADDPAYAQKAQRVSEITLDLVEWLTQQNWSQKTIKSLDKKVAFQCPCTLQHAQKLGGQVEALLQKLGAQMQPVADSHLCCGAAGSYTILQPEMATQLRDKKMQTLEASRPDTIVSANVGCQVHLNGSHGKKVRHWVELVDEALVG